MWVVLDCFKIGIQSEVYCITYSSLKVNCKNICSMFYILNSIYIEMILVFMAVVMILKCKTFIMLSNLELYINCYLKKILMRIQWILCGFFKKSLASWAFILMSSFVFNLNFIFEYINVITTRNTGKEGGNKEENNVYNIGTNKLILFQPNTNFYNLLKMMHFIKII